MLSYEQSRLNPVATADKETMNRAAAATLTLPIWTVPERANKSTEAPLRIAEVVSALSHALDLGAGEPVGHSVRTCILAMRIGEEIGLSPALRQELYYSAILKDAGCSSNASANYHAIQFDDIKAKHDVKFTDWTRTNWETMQYVFSHVAVGKPFLERSRAILRLALNQKNHTRHVTQLRCERGATIARLIGLPEATAVGIAHLDEHWDGKGLPEGRRKREISVLSRITLLAQTLEVFAAGRNESQALAIAKERSRIWFDPDLVKAAQSLAARNALWTDTATDAAFPVALDLEPEQRTMTKDDTTFDAICVAFAQIVDAKSPFTYLHSNGVARATVMIARKLGMSRERILFLRHAALLHDLGKMAVSNAILEKPGKLDDIEFAVVKTHPYYTWRILGTIPGFEETTEVAASHHEKLNGTGYFRGFSAEQLPLEARILVVADMFDALAAKRPYRDALPIEKVFEIMHRDSPHAIDANCLAALEESTVASDQSFLDLHTLNEQLTTPSTS